MSTDQPDEDSNVYQVLSDRLIKMGKSSEGLKRSAVVLPTISDNVEQELNERLNEVKDGPPERRLALIPSRPTNSY